MIRNLDITALRSFAAVVDAGGVTRAAARLNLTQSAVSMQLKRLEESMGLELLDRSGRVIGLTPQGEQLLSYARRMIALNDEAWGRMTNEAFEGEINFGVPHDLIYPHVPQILKEFAASYPRVKVQLHSLFTSRLRQMLDAGDVDIILTTESDLSPGGETLTRQPLVWTGAPGGQIWRRRPLRFAFMSHCMFKRPTIDVLDAAGIDWELAVDSVSITAVEASVVADLAVTVNLNNAFFGTCAPIPHGGALPDLPEYAVNLYVGDGPRAPLVENLAEFVRRQWRCETTARAA